MKTYIILGISILSGLIAFLMAQKHFTQRENELLGKSKKVEVLVAKRAIVAGEPLVGTDFTAVEYPVSLLSVNRQGRYDVITWENDGGESKRVFMRGYSLGVSLDKGQPLRWGQVDIGDSQRDHTFQSKVQKLSRGLTLPVDTVSSVANLIGPNDNVDIIATFREFPMQQGSNQLVKASMILLQNVKVLAVGKKYRGSVTGKGKSGYSSITLSVTPKEAEMLVFANQEGRLHFVLRNRKDHKFTDNTQQVNFFALQKNIGVYLEERKNRQQQGTDWDKPR